MNHLLYFIIAHEKGKRCLQDIIGNRDPANVSTLFYCVYPKRQADRPEQTRVDPDQMLHHALFTINQATFVHITR